GEFSNFARYPIVTDDVLWYSSEHYFQATKFPHDREYQEKMRTTKARRDIKRLGGTRQIKLRPDWEDVKEHVMMIALRAKLDQHPELKQLLLSTAGKSLVEQTEYDNDWGDAGDGSGLNRLGDLLAELSEYYLNIDNPPT
ncbi:MAG: NADAR family protein, partial [Candidatus Fonsibacter sp.]